VVVVRDLLFTDTFGVALYFKTGADLTEATSASVDILNPQGLVTNQSAIIHDSQNGIVKYMTAANDFESQGLHKMQVVVLFGVERKLRSDIVTFNVKQALQ